MKERDTGLILWEHIAKWIVDSRSKGVGSDLKFAPLPFIFLLMLCTDNSAYTLRGQVSMLIHMYSLTPQRNIKVTICKHSTTS